MRLQDIGPRLGSTPLDKPGGFLLPAREIPYNPYRARFQNILDGEVAVLAAP